MSLGNLQRGESKICPSKEEVGEIIRVMEKEYKVYMHVFPNGKVYIGITSQPLKNRWRYGKGYKNNIYITRAINKYGWENVKHKVLNGTFTRKEANEVEKRLVSKYKSNNPNFGYNITAGGDGQLGHTHTLSEEAKQKISKGNKGKTRTQEMKEHQSKMMRGRKLSKEVIEQMSKSHIGLKQSEACKEKIRQASKSYLRDEFGRFIRGDACEHY